MLRRQFLRQSRAIARAEALLPRSQSSSFSQLRHTTQSPLIRPATALPTRISQRWQSTEATKESAEPESKAPETAEPENPLQKELDAKSREVIDMKDKYLRSVADFRNLQDRTKRDMESARQFAIQRFATDLLDSIDNLDRALGSVPEASLKSASSASSSPSPAADDSNSTPASDEASSSVGKDLFNLHAGLKMTESILLSTLKKHGLERFDPLEGEGRKFDPRLDEATFFTKVEGKEDGEVFHTQSKGFLLNGRVIRAAKVGVVKNS